MERHVETTEGRGEQLRAHLAEQLGLPEGFNLTVVPDNHLQMIRTEEGTYVHDGHHQLASYMELDVRDGTYVIETWGTLDGKEWCAEATRLVVSEDCDPEGIVETFREKDIRFATTGNWREGSGDKHRLRLAPYGPGDRGKHRLGLDGS